MSRLQTYYKDTVVPQLMEQLSFGNIMQVPKISKITLNMGVGEAVGDKKVMDRAVGDMTAIAGQKPIVTNARRSVATFKIRDGWPVGCKVTLRQERMYEFLDRLVNVAIPRIRDFRGLNRKSFDGRGNYSMGVKEQIMFPEIDYDQIDVIRGMDITITTTAKMTRKPWLCYRPSTSRSKRNKRRNYDGKSIYDQSREASHQAGGKVRLQAGRTQGDYHEPGCRF